MDEKPVVFFCSPSEAKAQMEALFPLICADGWALHELWTQSFKAGSSYLDSLMEKIAGASFAVIVDNLPDRVNVRGEQFACPRDNSVFELGALVRQLGPKRVVLVLPTRTPVRLPTDYAGYKALRYDPSAGQPGQYMAEVGFRIRKQFKDEYEAGQETRKTTKKVPTTPSLSRMIIHTCREAEQQLDWYGELQTSLLGANPTLNSRMLYYGPGCAQLWKQSVLDGPAHHELKNAFENVLLQMLDPYLSRDMSVIDLGIGDFQKGNKLLLHLLDREGVDRVHYYPFDISYEMLAMALNGNELAVAPVLKSIYDGGGKVTGINGRFTDLYLYRRLFADAGRPSLFMLLGNTLGNEVDELNTLTEVRSGMTRGDILFVELQLAEEQPRSSEEITAAIQAEKYFYASPFITLGMHPDDIELTARSDHREAEERGIKAISYVISCRLRRPWRNPYPEKDRRSRIRVPQQLAIQVYVVRKYEEESIKRVFNQAGFQILESRISRVKKKSDRRFLFLAARPFSEDHLS